MFVTPISVHRAFVGEPGLTYRYFNIRLFAHPWRDCEPDNTDGQAARRVLHMLGRDIAAAACARSPAAAYTFNAALINDFDPRAVEETTWKDEPYYGMGRAAVKWHCDPHLKAGSAVGVYQFVPGVRNGEDAVNDWRIAFRRAWDDATPAVVFPARDGEGYVMGAGFNDTFQHAVLAGCVRRFSATYRDVEDGEDTLDYITRKCTAAIEAGRSLADLAGWDESSRCRVEQLQDALTTVEIDWIRQFWFQGLSHAAPHAFWRHHLAVLEGLWRAMEEQTAGLVDALYVALLPFSGSDPAVELALEPYWASRRAPAAVPSPMDNFPRGAPDVRTDTRATLQAEASVVANAQSGLKDFWSPCASMTCASASCVEGDNSGIPWFPGNADLVCSAGDVRTRKPVACALVREEQPCAPCAGHGVAEKGAAELDTTQDVRADAAGEHAMSSRARRKRRKKQIAREGKRLRRDAEVWDTETLEPSVAAPPSNVLELLRVLSDRIGARWRARAELFDMADEPFFFERPDEIRPVRRPEFSDSSPLPEDLRGVMAFLDDRCQLWLASGPTGPQS